MICPYCDSQIDQMPRNSVCPYCGGSLDVDNNQNRNLNDYYYQYKPNRLKAIKALRKDTGMGLVEAKDLIDQIFDELSGESHKELSGAWKILKDSLK